MLVLEDLVSLCLCISECCSSGVTGCQMIKLLGPVLIIDVQTQIFSKSASQWIVKMATQIIRLQEAVHNNRESMISLVGVHQKHFYSGRTHLYRPVLLFCPFNVSLKSNTVYQAAVLFCVWVSGTINFNRFMLCREMTIKTNGTNKQVDSMQLWILQMWI